MKNQPPYHLTATAIRVRVTHSLTEELDKTLITTIDRLLAKQQIAIPTFAGLNTISGSQHSTSGTLVSGSRVTTARHRWEDWEAFSLVRHGHDGGGAEGGNCEDDGGPHGGFVVAVACFSKN